MMGWYKGEGVQATTIHNRPCVPLRLSVGADVVRVLERCTCASAVVSYRPTDSPRPRESICYGYFGDIVAARIRRRRVAGRLRQLATAGAKQTKKLKKLESKLGVFVARPPAISQTIGAKRSNTQGNHVGESLSPPSPRYHISGIVRTQVPVESPTRFAPRFARHVPGPKVLVAQSRIEVS